MLPIHSPLDREIIVPEPIDKYPGYYYFPDYRHIGVSKDGKVIDIKSGKEIKVSFKKTKGGKNNSIKVTINLPVYLNNGIKKFVSYKYSRVLAKTFIGRPNIHKHVGFDFLQVNHIDVDSSNNHLDNLEWCTSAEGVRHAKSHYLKQNNKSTIVEIKNMHSNEVLRFESVGEASRYLDVKRATLSNALLKGFNYRYRIGDWIVRREDQEWPELNMAHSSLRPAVESRDYKIVDISNGNITIVSGVTEVSRLVGASRGRVDRGLKKDNVVQINGYEISYYE